MYPNKRLNVHEITFVLNGKKNNLSKAIVVSFYASQ